MEKCKTVRGVLLNEGDQVLLVRHLSALPADSTQPKVSAYWGLPGGEIADGESEVEALQRELQDVLGLSEVAIGHRFCVSESRAKLTGGGSIVSREAYYVCRMKEALDLNREGLSESEQQEMREIRWWSREELAESSEIMPPVALSKIVEMACSKE
ncbi:NUDIX domain-containing protein [Gimesia sp.]|uniref:NUDIX domain-containing protein n=1 Tax=Gimesia sp. TaxID=2024833 RepID=UPI003A8FB1E1